MIGSINNKLTVQIIDESDRHYKIQTVQKTVQTVDNINNTKIDNTNDRLCKLYTQNKNERQYIDIQYKKAVQKLDIHLEFEISMLK